MYDRLREDARKSIEESLADGDEPIYRIAENGDIQYADGRPINHWGDFVRALDERIAQTGRQIAVEEARALDSEIRELDEELLALGVDPDGRHAARADLLLEEHIAAIEKELDDADDH